MKIGMGVLVHSRPLHTALTLSYAMKNKSDDTNLHAFYSIHRNTTPPSPALDRMLKALDKTGLIQLHYLLESEAQNCGGNVNTLMYTLTSIPQYDIFMKIDDDVLIGDGTDLAMCSIQSRLEESDDVYMVMGQAVRQHMRGARPFCWETECDGRRVVQRANKACPMETYVAISPRLLDFLRTNEKSPSCDDKKGTFMPYTRKLTVAGGKSAVVLTPCIQMQHIGLSSTIDRGAARNWAPATSWEPAGITIPMEYFDFPTWEQAHTTGSLKEFTLGVLNNVIADIKDKTVQKKFGDVVLDSLKKYDPHNDVPLPSSPKRSSPVKIVRRDDTVRTDGRRIVGPKVVKRVIVKQPAVAGRRR